VLVGHSDWLVTMTRKTAIKRMRRLYPEQPGKSRVFAWRVRRGHHAVGVKVKQGGSWFIARAWGSPTWAGAVALAGR